MTTLEDRAELAWAALILRDERRRARTPDFGVTDSDVLDVIDEWSYAGTACGGDGHGCLTDECCDRQRLASIVWSMVEANDSAE